MQIPIMNRPQLYAALEFPRKNIVVNSILPGQPELHQENKCFPVRYRNIELQFKQLNYFMRLVGRKSNAISGSCSKFISSSRSKCSPAKDLTKYVFPTCRAPRITNGLRRLIDFHFFRYSDAKRYISISRVRFYKGSFVSYLWYFWRLLCHN